MIKNYNDAKKFENSNLSILLQDQLNAMSNIKWIGDSDSS